MNNEFEDSHPLDGISPGTYPDQHKAAEISSHEIRSYASGAIGMIQQLLAMVNSFLGGHVECTTEELHQVQDYLQMLVGVMQAIVAYASNIMNEAEQLPFNPEVICVEQEVRWLIKFLAFDWAGANQVTINLSYDEHLPKIRVDRSQLILIVMNLIKNAVEAYHHQQRVGAIDVHIGFYKHQARSYTDFLFVEPVGDCLVIAVNDQAGGMPDQLKSAILEQTTRIRVIKGGRLKKTTKGFGHGVGLSGVFACTKAHNAAMRWSNISGMGTLFQVYFPIVVAAPLPLQRHDSVRGVLLFDDSRFVLKVLADTLIHSGFTVHTASTLEQARQIFAEHQGDLSMVITDYCNGLSNAFCEEVLAVDMAMPYIFISGFPLGVEDVPHLRKPNVVALQKPVPTRFLIETIQGLTRVVV